MKKDISKLLKTVYPEPLKNNPIHELELNLDHDSLIDFTIL